eukprot:31303-Pelagococcus_subviridis.AAC.15
MLLVRANVILPQPHGSVLAHPNLLRDLVDEPEVVRHENDAAVVRVDRVRERVDALQIEVIRRLVQKQQVRLLHADHRVNQAALLPLGHLPNLRELHLPADAVPSEIRSPLVEVAFELHVVRVRFHEEVQHGGLFVQDVHGVLMVLPDEKRGVPRDVALRGRELAGHELQ